MYERSIVKCRRRDDEFPLGPFAYMSFERRSCAGLMRYAETGHVCCGREWD